MNLLVLEEHVYSAVVQIVHLNLVEKKVFLGSTVYLDRGLLIYIKISGLCVTDIVLRSKCPLKIEEVQ